MKQAFTAVVTLAIVIFLYQILWNEPPSPNSVKTQQTENKVANTQAPIKTAQPIPDEEFIERKKPLTSQHETPSESLSEVNHSCIKPTELDQQLKNWWHQLSPVAKQEVENWLWEIGEAKVVEQGEGAVTFMYEDYSQYELQVLKNAALSGSSRAKMAYAFRLRDKMKQDWLFDEEPEQWLRSAAIAGNVGAYRALAQLYLERSKSTDREENKVIQDYYDYYAWMWLADQRMGKEELWQYRQLPQEQISRISQRMEVHRQVLAEEREQVGLMFAHSKPPQAMIEQRKLRDKLCN